LRDLKPLAEAKEGEKNFRFKKVVEIRGLEPLTPSMPWKCSPN
jgi:hypothetical protein